MKEISRILIIILIAIQCLPAQNIHFPDPKFKAALIEDNIDGGDGEISLADAQAVTSLDVVQKMITDLTGIQYFSNLETLRCYNNFLVTLDVRALSKLKVLYCFQNSLTTLNVNGLTSLKELDCANNDLTMVDLHGCTTLEHIDFYHNSMTTLDVSGLTSLLTLSCYENLLTTLDVSGLVSLLNLNCHNNALYSIDIRTTPALNTLVAAGNPDLECIVVDDPMQITFMEDVDNALFTTEPCLANFEGLPILVGSVGLPFATEVVLQATLGMAEEACLSGSEWVAISSLNTFLLMTARSEQLGRLSASELDMITDATLDLIASIESGVVDCSSGSPGNIFDWIASWFDLEQSGVTMNGTISGYPVYHVASNNSTKGVYPNPTLGLVHFANSGSAEVYDFVGRLMISAKNVEHLDLHKLQSGVYVVRLINEGEVNVHRVVKK